MLKHDMYVLHLYIIYDYTSWKNPYITLAEP
jgi:hypothetical protein